MSDAVEYSNLSKPKMPGVQGLSPAQFLALIAAMFPVVLIMMFVGMWAGIAWLVLALAVLAPWIVGTMFLDTNPYSILGRRMRWSRANRKGLTTLAQGPAGMVPMGRTQLPGLAADTELVECEDVYGQPFGLIVHRAVDHYTVVIEASPPGVTGLDQESVDLQAAHWGTYLGVLSRERDLIGAQVVVDTAPDTGLRLERAAMADVDPNAPELARRVLEDVVAAAPAGAARITTAVTLTFDARRGDDRTVRDVDTMADDIGTRLPGLISQLATTGAGTALRARTAADIVDDTRVAFDPSVAPLVEEARQRQGGTGLSWEEAGPVSAHAARDHYSHDGSVSVSMMMVEPPRGVFYTLQLKGLLEPNARIARKRVAVLYRPTDPVRSANLAEWRVTSASADADSKRRTGASQRKLQALEAARENARAEAKGAPFTRVGLIVTATVEDAEDIAVTQSTLTTLSGQARLRLRPCWGMHDTAFVAGLPLGIVLPERLALPAFMREGL